MRVLLIPAKSNYPSLMPSVDHIGQALPYVAAALKSNGNEVFGMNMNHQWCETSAQTTLKHLLSESISAYEPQLIGISGISADYLFVRDTIQLIRKIAPDTPVVCGGGLISSDIEYIFPEFHPDFAVVGEGEETIIELLNCLEKRISLDTVNGIAYWKDGSPVYTDARMPITDLDEMPFPDYSPFDIETYLNMLNQKDGYFHCRTRHNPRLMPVSAARSCPYGCTFCYHTTGRKYRQRSIDNVIKEIEYFYEMYHFNILKLYDELFSFDNDRIRYFCQRIKDIGYDIHWSCAMRVGDVSLDLLREMKDAGCIHIGYGLESASPVVLKSMRKGVTVEQTLRALELTEKAGLGFQGNFIFGDLAETPETIQETKSFYNKYCLNHIVHCDYITPYHGSPIFKYCIERGIIPDRKWYYENIHQRPRINMTGMSYDEFRSLIDPIVNSRVTGVKAAAVATCVQQDSPLFDIGAPLKFRRDTYKVTTTCPHCYQDIDYLFPLRLKTNGVWSEGAISEPLTTICYKCQKRFVALIIDTTSIVKKDELPTENVAGSGVHSLMKYIRKLYGILSRLLSLLSL